MSTKKRTFVIVGAGLAGAKAAETLRDEGYDERIVVIGDEPELPYERPPLTKDYLRGESAFEKAVVHPASWYDEQKIDLVLETQVTAIDPRESVVTLRNGRRRVFDRLLLERGIRRAFHSTFVALEREFEPSAQRP